MILKKPYPPFLRESVILRIDSRILAATKAQARKLSKELGRRVHPGEIIEDALFNYPLDLQLQRPVEAEEVKRDQNFV